VQTNRKTAGDHLREWRGKRHMSQLDLASEAEISTRHLSFLETGRAQASREMLRASAGGSPFRCANAT
jgi:transcriptional regulator with XRE-family HTH domain